MVSRTPAARPPAPSATESLRHAKGPRVRRDRLVCALLEDVAVLDNLDAILSVPGIDLYSIGPNDFAQSLGYPGQPDHPESSRTFRKSAARIRQAGRTLQADVMQAKWVSDMLLDAGDRILSS